MSSNLQALINTARGLSVTERLELLRAVSQSLVKDSLPQSDFWAPQPLEQIVKAQKIAPIQDISELRFDAWPEDESADDLIKYIYQQRREDARREDESCPKKP